MEEETESGGAGEQAWTPRAERGAQRGEPLRAEACRAGGLRPGSSLHPEGLPARSSGLRPGARLSAQQTLSLGSRAEFPPLASSVYPEAGSGTLVQVSLSTPTLCRLGGILCRKQPPGCRVNCSKG